LVILERKFRFSCTMIVDAKPLETTISDTGIGGNPGISRRVVGHSSFCPSGFWHFFFILVKRVIEDLTELTPFFSSGEFFLFWSIFTGLLIPLSTFYFFRFLVLRVFPVQNSDLFYLSLPLPQWMVFHAMVIDLSVRNLPLVLAYLFATRYFFFDQEIFGWFLISSIPLRKR